MTPLYALHVTGVRHPGPIFTDIHPALEDARRYVLDWDGWAPGIEVSVIDALGGETV